MKIDKRFYYLLLMNTVVFAVVLFMHITTGAANLSLTDIANGMFQPSTSEGTVFWKLRVPRAVFAIMLGAGLAVCGVALQGLFRNPLAEPYTLGIAGGAGFGAVTAIVLGLSSSVWIFVFALLGALAVLISVYALAEISLFSQSALILCGVMIGYFFQSLLMLLLSITTSQHAHGALMWLLGDLSSVLPDMIFVTVIFIFIGCLFIIRHAVALDLLSMGEEKASTLGLNISQTRRNLFFWTSLVTGTCVASVGIVGFVGLIIPHVMRVCSGSMHSTLFPLCIVGGASFVLFCDLAAKTLFAPIELPLGVVTGMIGSVVFLGMFVQKGA